MTENGSWRSYLTDGIYGRLSRGPDEPVFEDMMSPGLSVISAADHFHHGHIDKAIALALISIADSLYEIREATTDEANARQQGISLREYRSRVEQRVGEIMGDTSYVRRGNGHSPLGSVS